MFIYIKIFLLAGLDGKGVWLHLHAPLTCHIKNRNVVHHMPKRLYVVLFQLLLIHSSSTFLIALFLTSHVKLSVLLYSTFYLLFFVHVVKFSFSCSCHLLPVSFVCKCNKKYRRRYDLVYQFFDTIFF